jgi:hypothetical protein
MDTRRGSNHNNKGKHSRYADDNEEEKSKRSRANNSNAGGNSDRSINMELEKPTHDVAMHPVDLATNKKSSLSVAENSALVFEHPLNDSPTQNTSPKTSDDNNNNISEPSNNGNNDNISESSAASSLSAAENSTPLDNSPTHNTSPKLSEDDNNNNNITEPSNNGNNDDISELLAVMAILSTSFVNLEPY